MTFCTTYPLTAAAREADVRAASGPLYAVEFWADEGLTWCDHNGTMTIAEALHMAGDRRVVVTGLAEPDAVRCGFGEG